MSETPAEYKVKPAKYRVYVRWPNQKVTEKTVTDNPIRAQEALRALVMREDLQGVKCAVAYSVDTKQQDYVEMNGEIKTCECGYHGPFISRGQECPKCSKFL